MRHGRHGNLALLLERLFTLHIAGPLFVEALNLNRRTQLLDYYLLELVWVLLMHQNPLYLILFGPEILKVFLVSDLIAARISSVCLKRRLL